MQHTSRFLALVETAKAQVPEISVPELAAHLENPTKTDTVVIDTREESEWNAGTIPGAIHLGKGVIERDIEAQIPDTSTRLLLFCGGGYRSLLAGQALQQMGYTNVASLAGGIAAWSQHGLPIVKP